MHTRFCIAAVGAVLAAAGCSSAGPGVGAAPSASTDVITREQIEQSSERSAYDVVRTLRYTWLQTRFRGPGGADPVWVYIDAGTRQDLNALRDLDASNVVEMRYLDATEATTRFGTGHTSGAILVFTVRRR